MGMKKENILHLLNQVKFEEFEIYLLIRKAKPSTRQEAITV
jgi:hypothetical protein